MLHACRSLSSKPAAARRCCDESMGQTDRPSAGLMPTEARGNYLPEAAYLRETKTYLNCNSRMQCMGTSNLHDYQHNTTMSVQFSSLLSQRPIFIYFFGDVMSNYLTTDGLKKLLYSRRPRPEA